MHDHFFFFFNDTATTEIYTLSLHDALPISMPLSVGEPAGPRLPDGAAGGIVAGGQAERSIGREFAGLRWDRRSEEHTSELQSRQYLVCRLLLEKKKKQIEA